MLKWDNSFETLVYKHKMNIIIIIIIIGTNMGHKICSKVTSSNSHLEYCGTENNKILIFFHHSVLF